MRPCFAFLTALLTLTSVCFALPGLELEVETIGPGESVFSPRRGRLVFSERDPNHAILLRSGTQKELRAFWVGMVRALHETGDYFVASDGAGAMGVVEGSATIPFVTKPDFSRTVVIAWHEESETGEIRDMRFHLPVIKSGFPREIDPVTSKIIRRFHAEMPDEIGLRRGKGGVMLGELALVKPFRIVYPTRAGYRMGWFAGKHGAAVLVAGSIDEARAILQKIPGNYSATQVSPLTVSIYDVKRVRPEITAHLTHPNLGFQVPTCMEIIADMYASAYTRPLPVPDDLNTQRLELRIE